MITGPLDLDAVLSEFQAALETGKSLGAKAWLSWRRWRAEWSGQRARLTWEADNYREVHMLYNPLSGRPARTLDEVLDEMAQATAMEILLDDVAAAIRHLGKKGASK
jgi:hypothetical protein